MRKIELPKKIKLPKRTSTANGLKPPQFAADLYADLRDRRLLPLVALLVVAIVAAPLLLAGGEEEPPASPAPVVSAAPAPASFSVVPADPGLRDYRERLGHRQAESPFQRPAEKKAGSEDVSAESASVGVGTEGGTGEAPVSEAPSGGSTPTGGEAASTETTTKVVVQNQVIGYAIDARVGFLGHVKPQEDIAPTTKLPNKKNPVVVFMGLTEDKKRALLLMTNSVTAYYGKGRCALEKESCQLLELKPGKSVTFAYGYGDTRYKLILQKIVPVIATRESAATVTTEGSKTTTKTKGQTEDGAGD